METSLQAGLTKPMGDQIQRVLGVIPARGGSKGLPRKNILSAAGRPLIAWTVDAGLKSSVVDKLIVSSDDDEIISIAVQLGCVAPFKRPTWLSSDTASSIDVVTHALDQLPPYDYVVLLQPTSPLRSAGDIDAAFALMREHSCPACVSVSLVDMSPYWMYTLTGDSRLAKIVDMPKGVTRRQDLPPVYALNGAIYIAQVDWLRANGSFVSADTVAYEMPSERSIDIDTAQDFEAFRRVVE